MRLTLRASFFITQPYTMLALVLLSLLAAAANSQLTPDVDQLMTDYWNWRMEDMPEFASFVGIHDYDDRLDDLTRPSFSTRYDNCELYRQRATDLEATVTDHIDVINLRALKAELQTFIDGYQFEGFLQPLCYSEGVHIDFERLISWMILDTAEDYQKLISRYQELPQQMQQTEDLMKEGVSKGIINHAISMKGVAENLSRFVVEDAESSPLWKPFQNITIADATQETIDAIQNTARGLIVDQLSPAFAQLRDYVANEYVTRPDIAITSLPNGEARYNALLKFHTSTNLTAQEIHEKGLAEVERIEAEMAKIVEELGYDMTVGEFSDMIRNDPNNFYDNADDLMAEFKYIVYNIITPRMPELFVKVPETELQVVADPSPDGSGAFYLSGSYDGSRPGIFYVNTYHVDAQPKYTMMSLSLHEGNPGHHLQSSYAIESVNMPFFRRTMEDRRYCYSPSRFPINTAYVEGWGLYSENLGFDLNLYQDALVRYGHYSMEIFRASRMVVDTGMHALGWTKAEAIEFMVLHTAEAEIDIQNEIDRYITWPGQAVAYKVGQMKIQELRDRASAALGEAFDVKEYHDIVMSSVGPLDLLEDEVDEWISASRMKKQKM